MKTLKTTYGAATESALDLQTVKADLRISGTELDSIMTAQYIPAAIAWGEGVTRRVFVQRIAAWVIDRFPTLGRYTLYLPGGKVTAVASIQYISDGNLITLTGPDASPAGTDFQQSLGDRMSRIMPAQGETWPEVDSDAIDPITVNYTAGWPTAAEVPADIKRALTAYVYGAMELDGLLQIRQGFDFDHPDKLISAYRAVGA